MAQSNSRRRSSRSSASGPSRSRPSRRGKQGQGSGSARSRSGAGRGQRGLGGDQVEGRQAVRELLIAGKRTVREIFLSDDIESGDSVEDIVALATDFGVPVKTVSPKRLRSEAVTQSHQGVVARAAPVEETSLDSLIADANAFLLVLDGVTDPRNLGALLRIADCAGVTGIVLGRHRSVHITPSVTKTSAGAVEYLSMALVGGIPATISTLKEAGVFTIGLDAAGETSIFDTLPEISGPLALVLGAEGKGISRLSRERVDLMVSIPLGGQLASLNVATAGAVACFEMVRRRQWSAPQERGVA